MVSSTSQPHFTPGKDPVPILQEAGWAPGPVWTGGKFRPHRDSIPDRPACCQTLYRLSYRAHIHFVIFWVMLSCCTFVSRIQDSGEQRDSIRDGGSTFHPSTRLQRDVITQNTKTLIFTTVKETPCKTLFMLSLFLVCSKSIEKQTI